jgi:type II secretory pathway pseudopilin PulG
MSAKNNTGRPPDLPPAITAEDGFSLVETVVAMLVLVIGLLGMAQVFYAGMTVVSTSSPAVVAREKAREAIESVHSARDTRVITWAQIRNLAAPPAAACSDVSTTPNGGGIFRNGAVRLGGPGPDGLVNTADDTAQEIAPGKDNVLGTSDDIRLQGFTREINICDVIANPNLRMIEVVIRYNTGSPKQQEYRMTSYISRFS